MTVGIIHYLTARSFGVGMRCFILSVGFDFDDSGCNAVDNYDFAKEIFGYIESMTSEELGSKERHFGL